MISTRELAYGLVGAWRLMRNDASGLQYFDRSPHGALRSFWVMVLAAPAYAVLLMLQFNQFGVAQIGLRQILIGGGIYVIETSENEQRVPGFWKLPVLGYAFKNNGVRDRRKELLIFVQPSVVVNPQAAS